jgi:hypothetical protein
VKKRTILFLSVVLTCLCSSGLGTPSTAARADTSVIRVAPSGSDTAECGSETLPCQTIQYAVNMSDSGDTLLVAGSGGGEARYTYDASSDVCSGSFGTTAVVCIVNKQLTILGGYSTANWSTPDPSTNLTIIDGQSTYRGVFTRSGGPTTSLRMEGFTIENGLAQGIPAWSGDDRIFGFGGGMFAISVQGITLKNMVFEDNTSVGENTSSSYGGAGSGGGLALRRVTNATLEHITFEDNEARGGTGQDRGGYGIGGGLYTYRSVVSGRYITFTNNIATGGSTSGSGRAADGQRADAFGAGASIQHDCDVRLQYVSATNNQTIGGNASTYAGGAFGGALKVEKATLELIDADLRQNLAQGGQAQNGYLGNGGGLEAIDSDVTLDRVTIIGNTARGGDGTSGDKGAAGGGGINSTWISSGYDARLSISNSIIANNVAEMGAGVNVTGGGGGGIWVQATEADIVHTTVARNRVDSPMQGQGILLIEVGSRDATADISHSIVADHTGFGGSVAALHVKPGNTVNLQRGLWSGNDKDTNADGSPAPAGTFNGLVSMISGSANFISPGAPNYDYHVLGSSAARDQATGSTVIVDIDGESRNLFGEHDIGADEYAPIILSVSPVMSRTLHLRWQTNASLVTGMDHYDIVFSYESGASPPDQGDSPIDAGIQTAYTLTGLSNYKRYSIRVEARDASDRLIASSNTVDRFPTDILAYLPLVLR